MNLTIGLIGHDNTIAVQTYSLSYDAENGYTAYRIYGTNDALRPFKQIIEWIKQLFQKIIDAFKGLSNG